MTAPVQHSVRAVAKDGLGYAITTGTQMFDVRPRRPLFGFAAPTVAAFAALNAEIGPVQARRSFLPPESNGWSTTPYMVNQTAMLTDQMQGRTSIWSWKPNVVAFANGLEDAAFKSLLASIKHTAYIGLWHEPGSEFRSGLFTPAQWHAANNRMGRLIHQNGNPRLKSFICLEGRWAFIKGTASTGGFSSFEYWHPDFAQNIDAIAFDQYTYPAAGPFNIHELLAIKTENMVAAPMAWARAKSKPVLVTEWGVSDAWGSIEKVKRIKQFWEWCKQQPDIRAVSYFHNNADVSREPQFTWETAPSTDARAALRIISDDAKV